MSPRDDFSAEVKRILAGRVGLLCSNPECRALTGGPQSDPAKVVNIGVAAHITAAAQGGPRFDENLSADERSSPTNGIWLCQNCAKRIDSDVSRYPADSLQEWKRSAESRADLALGKGHPVASQTTSEPSTESIVNPPPKRQRWKPIAAVLSSAAAVATVATFLGFGRRSAAPSPFEYAERRPWVGIGAIHLDPLTPGRPPRAEMVIRNRGKTPAKDLVLRGFIVTSPHRINDPEAEVTKGLSETPVEIPTVGALLAGEDTTIPFTSSINLTEGMVAAFKDASGHIYLIGRIDYRDVFERQHTTRFFRHYLPSANRFESDNAHNDAD